MKHRSCCSCHVNFLFELIYLCFKSDDFGVLRSNFSPKLLIFCPDIIWLGIGIIERRWALVWLFFKLVEYISTGFVHSVIDKLFKFYHLLTKSSMPQDQLFWPELGSFGALPLWGGGACFIYSLFRSTSLLRNISSRLVSILALSTLARIFSIFFLVISLLFDPALYKSWIRLKSLRTSLLSAS